MTGIEGVFVVWNDVKDGVRRVGRPRFVVEQIPAVHLEPQIDLEVLLGYSPTRYVVQ